MRNGISNYALDKLRKPLLKRYGSNVYQKTNDDGSVINYWFGDQVTWTDAGGVARAYVCIKPNTTGPSSDPSDTTAWVSEPWLNHPVKTPINTASFEQLWVAFWEVMTDESNNAPQGGPIGRNPIRNPEVLPLVATSGTPVPGAISPSGGDDTGPIQAAIDATPSGGTLNFAPGTYHISGTLTFKSGVIYNGTPGSGGGSSEVVLAAADVMKMRSAIAALNAAALRSGSGDVKSTTLYLGKPVASSVAAPTGGGTILAWGGGNGWIAHTEGSGHDVTVTGITFDGGGFKCEDGASNINFSLCAVSEPPHRRRVRSLHRLHGRAEQLKRYSVHVRQHPRILLHRRVERPCLRFQLQPNRRQL